MKYIEYNDLDKYFTIPKGFVKYKNVKRIPRKLKKEVKKFMFPIN